MTIAFGRETCGELSSAEQREWLVTNGIGGYASGTIAGLLTRGYHGLLVAALKPPLGRTLLLTKLDETAQYAGQSYPLFTNRWTNNDTVDPTGYIYTESFHLEGSIPVWTFACGAALLQKRVWMQQGANTTYIHYTLQRATQPLTLSLKALVNYRDYHSRTQADGWQMAIQKVTNGVSITAFPGATPFYLLTDNGTLQINGNWNYGFELAAERARGLKDSDDNLQAAIFYSTLQPGDSLTFVASLDANPALHGTDALSLRRTYEQKTIEHWKATRPTSTTGTPGWIEQLVLAADQFIVERPLTDQPAGKSIIAGYHWFGDWGRDTMISLPGLTLTTGRPEIASTILRTFAQYVNQGMLPNNFPDDGRLPGEDQYNTVDAPLWYFEAVRLYYAATSDKALLQTLFPVLTGIIDSYSHGTCFNIKLDTSDNLIYAGASGVQLTWMDAKVGDWIVTPRIGKPVEINALWYNALRTMSNFAQQLQQPHDPYATLAEATLKGFQRFWNESTDSCFDVLDGPQGNDAALRPNQIFAVSLPESPLTIDQQRNVLATCERFLLTSHGLHSLAPTDPNYHGQFTGDQYSRDSAYHQGTVWGWLIGPFVLAHLRVFNKPEQARQFLLPLSHHLWTAGLGTISEIFNGDAPLLPQGCIAQAWSVAEVLRAWQATL